MSTKKNEEKTSESHHHKDKDNNHCNHCGKELIETETHSKVVRDGISTDYMALPFIYRRKQLCEACFKFFSKKERLDRVLAIIGIIIVITLILSVMLPAFF